jgi:hypothetical protein
MKKIFTTIVMAIVALTASAQNNQQYFHVEFTVPITGDNIPIGQSNNSVAATMKDDTPSAIRCMSIFISRLRTP